MSDWVFLDKSQTKNISSRLAELSILWVKEAPHDVHLHLRAPDEVVPLRFVFSPHVLHFGLFAPAPGEEPTFSLEKLVCTGVSRLKRTRFLSG